MTTRRQPINHWTPLEDREPGIPRRATKQATLRPRYEAPVPIHHESRPVQRLSTTQALPIARPISASVPKAKVKRGGSGRVVMALGTGMFCMSILYFIAVSYVLPTAQATRDRWEYGRQGVNRVYMPDGTEVIG